MANRDYTGVYTIQIAPSREEIVINGDTMHTDFAGGITYTAEGLSNYKDDYLKCVFRTAIAMLSHRWQMEESLNNVLKLDGKIK